MSDTDDGDENGVNVVAHDGTVVARIADGRDVLDRAAAELARYYLST